MSCTHNCRQGRDCTCSTRSATHRTLDVLMVICVTAFACWLLGVFGPTLDMHDSANTTDAQHQAQAELRRDLAAARICREAHGDASFTWTAAGELVCIPRQGKHAIVQAAL